MKRPWLLIEIKWNEEKNVNITNDQTNKTNKPQVLAGI